MLKWISDQKAYQVPHVCCWFTNLSWLELAAYVVTFSFCSYILQTPGRYAWGLFLWTAALKVR